jgi:hypothetical protein
MERMQRAQDLCMQLRIVKSIDGAIKIAVHHHMPALAERMNQIKERKLRQADEEEVDLPTTFDIKSYIRDELEKTKSQMGLETDTYSQHLDDDRASEIFITSTLSTEPMESLKSQAKAKKMKKTEVPKPVLNPFAIDKTKKSSVASNNGNHLLSAIASTMKPEGT